MGVEFAKRFGKTEAKVAEEIGAAAEKAGVDLEKAAQGDRVEAAKLAKVTREYPKGQAERIKRTKARTKHEPKLGRESEELVAKQAEEAPKYKKEIETYEGERATRRAKREQPATEPGKRSKLERHKRGELDAKKILPSLEKDAAQVKKIEGMLDKVKNPKEEVLLRKKLRDAVAKRDQLQRKYDRAVQQQITGSDRKLTPSQMTKNAEEKVHKLLKDIKDGEEIKLLKWDYNPERIAKAKELPNTPVDLKYDYHQRVHDIYGKEYERALSEIRKNLGRKDISPEHRSVLKRQEEVMQKLSDHIQADKRLNQHQQSLIQMGRRGRVAKKLAEKKPIKGHVVPPEGIKAKSTALKTEKATKGKTFEALSDKQAERVAEEINKSQRTKGTKGTKEKTEGLKEKTKEKTTKEDIKEAEEEVKTGINKLLHDIANNPTIKTSWNQGKEFFKIFSKKPFEAIINTSVGTNDYSNSDQCCI